MQNNALRKELLKKRSQITDRKAKERAIAARLKPFLSLISPADLAGYSPIGSEADPFGWLVPVGLLPKVTSNTEMVFLENKDLALGTFDVMEPQADSSKARVPLMILVPLLGFDGTNRIGYGKGYYDRYLADHPSCFSIGIAFEEQSCNLDVQPWDVALDAVITPERIILEHHDRAF